MDTPAGRKRVLVATPTRHIKAGRSKLEELRRTLDTSNVDLEIVEHIGRHPKGTFSVFVFSGRDPNDAGSWRFDPELDEEGRFELAYLMWKSQLPLNRFCAAMGIHDSVYVEWTELEVEAFAAAAERLQWETRSSGPLHPEPDDVPARVRRLNLWLLERHAFFMSMRTETLLSRILPPRLARLGGRAEVVEDLLEELPATATNGRDAFMT
jgi:hypothetical protein